MQCTTISGQVTQTQAGFSAMYLVADEQVDFMHMAWLTMSAPELDLDLLYWNGTIWKIVMIASGEDFSETISFAGNVGNYAWRIRCDNCSTVGNVRYSLTYAQPELASNLIAQCSRCSGCCDCSTAHVCYQCGPEDGIITDFVCYPDATFVVPAAVGMTMGIAVLLSIWMAVKYRRMNQNKNTNDATVFAGLHRALVVSATVFAVIAVIFLTLSVVYSPQVGVNPDCDDCNTMVNAFWGLFAASLVFLGVTGFLYRSMTTSSKQSGTRGAGDTGGPAYVSLNNDQ